MTQAPLPPDQLQSCIERLQAGDPAARAEIMHQACERLRLLTRKMLKGFGRVHRWEDTDDVLQNALLRLWKALERVTPNSSREFYGLASLEVRRELIDLARHYYGPEGEGAKHVTRSAEGPSSQSAPPAAEPADLTHDPGRLALWTDFHRHVEALPPEEREVFDLLWYQELKQVDAAAVLGISEATLKRRWVSARLRLHQALEGRPPF
jgi:RNA polymerase sigma-70 factor (ECF subfamily)